MESGYMRAAWQLARECNLLIEMSCSVAFAVLPCTYSYRVGSIIKINVLYLVWNIHFVDVLLKQTLWDSEILM